MSDIKLRRGETLSRMLGALGSSKPWVSRSLRQWGVSVRDDGIIFNWRARARAGGAAYVSPETCCMLSPNRFRLLAFAILLAKPGECRVDIGVDDDRNLVRCEPDSPHRVVSITPEWATIVVAGSDWNMPTKLLVESMRMANLGQRDSRGLYRSKRQRRAHLRHRVNDRRAYRRLLSDHLRRTNLALVARMIQESPTVELNLEPGDPRIEQIMGGQSVLLGGSDG